MKHLERLLDHLKGRAFQRHDPPMSLRWREATPEERRGIRGGDRDGWAPVTPETIWGSPQKYFWFEGAAEIPAALDGCRVYLWVEAQFGRVMGRSDPQCLVFVNGVPRQGVDFNHREVLLTDAAVAGERFEILIEAGTIEDRLQIGFGCTLMVHDAQAEALYYDLRVPLDVAMRLPENDHRRDVILQKVEGALNTVDLREGNPERFADSLERASAIAAEIYRAPDPSEAKVSLVGHTHIDVAWLWRVRETRQKMARSMATVLSLMEQYPAYQFMYNQGYLLETLSEDYPELFDGIRARHAEGRFEIEGALWLEPDANMTGGESLVRHVLRGVRYHQDKFGVTPRVVWLPDTFGYSAALPQIMALSGQEIFVTHKMSWNDTNKIPSEIFWWEGIDGSRVPTYFLTTQPMESSGIGTTYCPDLKATHVMGAWRRLSRKDLVDEVFAVYGHGDGGGGPTREMLEHIRRMERGIPGCPRVEHAHMGAFLKRLVEKMDAAPARFPEWVGELYLEFHRGTFTSVAEVKRNNRKAEAALRSLEALATYAMVRLGKVYPKERLEKLWDIALLNQFHDILPGSSIGPVYDDSRAEFEVFFAQASALEAELLADLECGVFNPTASTSAGFVMGDEQVLHFADGSERSVQKTGPVEPMSGAVAEPEPAGALFASSEALENAYLRAAFNAKGQLSSLIDKHTGREVLSAPANHLIAFRDLPAQYDAWDIDLNYRDQSWEMDELVSAALVEQGPHRAAIRFEWRYESSRIVQVVSLCADARHLEFDTAIDWREKHTLLKAAFPLDLPVRDTVAEMQFGHVRRPTHTNTSWDAARFEYPMHRWVAAGEPGLGVALLNDCKYGYDFDDGALRLTILRAPAWPWKEADIGAHHLRYGLLVHHDLADVPGVAEAFNQPLVQGAASQGEIAPLLVLDNEAIAIEAIKKAEDDDSIIVRLYERSGRRSHVHLSFSAEITAAEVVNLLEEGLAALEIDHGRAALTFRAFEIKTLKLSWSR